MMLLLASVFFYPFLPYDRRKSLNLDEASGMNASDLEHMYLCPFSMLATLPSSRYSSSVKRSGMNIGISSVKRLGMNIGTSLVRHCRWAQLDLV